MSAIRILRMARLCLAPAALDHFPALTIRATISAGVSRLVAVLPKKIEVAVWFYFLKVDFVGIGLMVRSRIRDVEYHEFG